MRTPAIWRVTLVAAVGAALLAVPASPATAASAVPRVAALRSTVAATSITLRWGGPVGRYRFEVRYRLASAKRWRLLHVGARHRYVKRRLAPGKLYAFAVRACRRGRCSRWSRVRKVRTATAASGTIPPGAYPPGIGTGGCPVFPPDNAWHHDVSADPVDPGSGAYIASIGATTHLHPDFGSNPAYGMPYVVVGATQPAVPIHFTAYGSQSDPGPYPVPRNAPVEGAGAPGDRHVLVLQSGACRLYELYSASVNADGSWNAASGAAFDLRSNALRPDGWTSADAAGLPIFGGLIRYDEVQAGVIDHAIRFTVSQTQRGYIHPATHFASSDANPSLPPMGLRLRLKAGFDIAGFSPANRVILTAMKRYGLIVADNGSNWFFGGASDARWNDEELNQLKSIPGSAFEVVQSGPILHAGG